MASTSRKALKFARQTRGPKEGVSRPNTKTSIMSRGPMLADDGASPAGSVILMDIPDMAAGRALLENMPFFKAGCYQDVTFHRWRFGRVFDRYTL